MPTIGANEITELLRQQIENYDERVQVDEVGTIVTLGDGIARVHGLDKVMAGELIDFPHGVSGLAMNLEEDQVGTVLLGDYTELREGQQVKRTGKIMAVPVGEAMIGRVVNALGQPIDDKGPIQTTQTLPIERLAPGVIDRQSVTEPMYTGIKAIDAMIPIGRGQRELLIGDRQTGKTAVALDTIINSAKNDLICIYCAIGQKRSSVAQVVQTLERFGGDGLHHRGGRDGLGTRADAVPRPLRGNSDGRVLPRQRQACPRHLRRPLQARGKLPRDLLAAAPAARPRGRIRAMSSTSTRGSSSAPPSCRRRRVPAR